MTWRTTIWFHWHPDVSIRRISSCCQIPCSPARISGRNSWRRLQPMCRLYSTGQRSPTCWCWGQPCLWVRCILEVMGVMEWYMSLFDDTVLDGVALPEGFLEDQPMITVPRNAQLAFTYISHQRGCCVRNIPHWGPPWGTNYSQAPCEEWTKVEASPNQFPIGGKCCIPPSWLPPLDKPIWPSVSWGGGTAARVLGKGELDTKGKKSTSKSSEQSEIPHHHPGLQNQCKKLHCPLATRRWQPCLKRDPLSVTAFEVPPEPMQPEAMVNLQ